MSFLEILIKLFDVGLETLIAYYFMTVIIGRPKASKRTLIIVYALFSMGIFLMSLFVKQPLLMASAGFSLNLLVSLFYERRFFLKVFLVFIKAIFMILSEMISVILLATFCGQSVEAITSNWVFYLQTVIIARLFIFTIIKVIEYRRLFVNSKLSKSGFIFLLFTPLSTILMAYIISEFAYYNLEVKHTVFAIIAISILFLSNFLILILFERQLRQNDEKEKSMIIQQQLVYKEQYFKELIERQKESNKEVHNIRNKLFAISAHMNNGDIETANKEISTLQENIFGDSNTFNTGNDSIDALIDFKSQRAKESNISFQCEIHINPKNKIEDIDLCIVMGNALDNAIEACERIEDEGKRIINMKAIQVSNKLSISISNTFNNSIPLHKLGDEIRTTKRDKYLHGFGLESIKEIVDKYNGHLTISQEDNVFSLIIFMENHIL